MTCDWCIDRTEGDDCEMCDCGRCDYMCFCPHCDGCLYTCTCHEHEIDCDDGCTERRASV
jgi:hypothetical protein